MTDEARASAARLLEGLLSDLKAIGWASGPADDRCRATDGPSDADQFFAIKLQDAKQRLPGRFHCIST